jgi:hypothetical protein
MQMEAERIAAMDDSWREAYDERLNSWKAENATRRDQSEKTRTEWEKRRSLEPPSNQPFPKPEASSMASSYVDARDLVSGEHQGGHGKDALDVSLATFDVTLDAWNGFIDNVIAGASSRCTQ